MQSLVSSNRLTAKFLPLKSLIRSKFTGYLSKNPSNVSVLMDIHPNVQEAIHTNRPIVALESTIITHGMPQPHNLETALEVEEIVRKEGSTPATIAAIDGRIKVGLTKDELRKLSSFGNQSETSSMPVKCSRRDLAYVLSKGLSGGTTVAGTLIIAKAVGIKIFATGGIGGVHREGHLTFDISADLIELGRSPVAVISSGIKSILDIERTLEYLETQGVCVASYKSSDRNFPAFYTRSSGIKAPYNLETSKEAAALIKASLELNLNSGILIGVPIPHEFAIDEKLVNDAIENALKRAKQEGVSGKEVTPFILQAVAETTMGKSLQANIALIKNNARIASQIAVELTKFSDEKLCKNHEEKDFKSVKIQSEDKVYSDKMKELDDSQKNVPIIVGASMLDVCLTVLDDDLKIDGATYQVKSLTSGGGVGRNLCEGIYKLHGAVSFISAIGNDEYGRRLQQLIPKSFAGEGGVIVDPLHSTSTCTIVLDRFGDCKLMFGDFVIHKSITPELILKHETKFAKSPLVIFDANMRTDTMEIVFEFAKKYNKPVFFEPTDMRIASTPFQLPRNHTKHIKFISPNLFEINEIAKVFGCQQIPIQHNKNFALQKDVIIESAKVVLNELNEHFDCIILTLSNLGTCIARKGSKTDRFFDENFNYISTAEKNAEIRYYPTEKVENLINVSGAGDSFTSGFITAMLRGKSEEECVRIGFEAAKCALMSESAVPEKYSNIF